MYLNFNITSKNSTRLTRRGIWFLPHVLCRKDLSLLRYVIFVLTTSGFHILNLNMDVHGSYGT